MPGYTSAVTKAPVIDLRNSGHSYAEIGLQLEISHSTASRIYDKYHESEDFESVAPKLGRPCKLTDRDTHVAALSLSRNPKSSAAQVQRELFPEVHPDTVRRRLRDIGINAHAPRAVPLLSQKAIRMRLAWGLEHSFWLKDAWEKVIFSDESKFNLFGSDGRQYVWRRDGEALDPRYTKKTVKYGGGSVMVWGCVTAYGVGRLICIHGTMNKEKYVAILTEGLLDTLANLPKSAPSLTFQRDNDPKHKSGLATNWMAAQGIPVLPWPSYSPDMNIIEHIWALLDRRVRARTILPQNCNELWEALQEEWVKIDSGVISNYYASMPKRVQELIDNEGGSTSY
jgi:transposase